MSKAAENRNGVPTGRFYKLYKKYTPEGRYRDGQGRRFSGGTITRLTLSRGSMTIKDNLTMR